MSNVATVAIQTVDASNNAEIELCPIDTDLLSVESCHISSQRNETPAQRETWRLPGNLPIKTQFSH